MKIQDESKAVTNIDSRPPSPRRWTVSFLGACLALAAAIVVNHFAGQFAASRGRDQPSLTADLLLSVLPHWDTGRLFVWGFAAFIVLGVIGAAVEWRRAPYIVWMYALLILLRSSFIILTPMGPPPGAALPHGDVLFDLFGRRLTFGYDLFFSSHTALPFLGFLVFRRPLLRGAMLVFSVVLAGGTLVGHFHYTIDVAAAYFIVYALVAVHDLAALRAQVRVSG